MELDTNFCSISALEWYSENDLTKTLKDKFMSPGLPLFAGRLLTTLENCAIDCHKDESTWKSPVLTHIAICYEAQNLTQVECGQLFGGKQGTCPKYGMVWWLHSKAEDRKHGGDKMVDDSPNIILMNSSPDVQNDSKL